MRNPLRAITAGAVILTASASAAGPPAVEVPRALRPDLAIELFASEPDIATPIAIDADGNGRVWAIESNTHFQDPGYPRHATDRILVIEGAGGGKAGRFSTFADGLQQSMALALERSGPRALTPAGSAGRALLLATRRDVRRLEDADGDGRCDRTVFLAQLETREQYPHNGLSGFAFDDLGRIYFAIGENMGVPYVLTAADGSSVSGGPDGGSIFRMRAGGTHLERWAFGFWNTFHMAFDAFGRLFAVDNDPDSRPPCRLLHIVAGGDYGYRRWLGRKGLHPFTAWDGEIAGTLPMVAGTGEAPSGILPCEETGLPADLRGKLLVTSWGDHRIEAYALEERGASFRSRPVPIVEGGAMFRPVGIAAAPDGSIYITDWVDQEYHVHGKGRIWRLRAKEVEGAPPAEESAGAGPGPRARYAALCELARAGALAEGGRPAGIDDPDPAVRAAAVRLLGETASGIPDGLLASLARDPAPAVRLEGVRSLAARASGGGPSAAVEEAVMALVVSDDPFLFEGAVAAMARRGAEHIAGKARGADARVRLAALLALRRAGGARAAEPLRALLADPDPEVRRAAIQWAGEERRKDLREEVEEAFRKGPPSRTLFEAWLAASSLIAGESPEGSDMTPRDDFLVAIARDGGRPAEVRAMALRAAPASHARLGASAFRGLLEESDLSLRLESVRSFRESAVPEAAAMLSRLAADRAEPAALRREAVAGLSRFAAEARPALEGLLSDDDPAVRAEAARAIRWADGAAPAPAGSAPPVTIDEASLLSGGNPAEGEIIFFHPRGPRCFACHAALGRGGRAGPDLSAAGSTPRAKLIESLLDPGKEVAPQYATWVLETDGGVVTGVLLGEDAHAMLHVADGAGEVRSIPAAKVRSRTMSGTSIMPADLTRRLTAEEIRDLVAFLEGMK